MAVAAHNRCARECEALLWSDYVYDALPLVTEAEVCKAKIFDVLLERSALCSGISFLNKSFDVLEVFTCCGGDVLGQCLSSDVSCMRG